jgi:putative transcriptional regulator
MTQTPAAFADRLRTAPDAGLRLLASAAAELRDASPAPGEGIAGLFLEAEAPAALSADAADQALARIEALERSEGSARARQAATAAAGSLAELLALPDAVRHAAFEAIAAGRDWGFAGFGIRRLPLAPPASGEARIDLLRIEPGRGVAPHDHRGEEYTLVLAGAFHDGHGTYRPGDINVGLPGFTHEPRALPGAACYALALSYGPLVFEGPVGLLQRLTGFGG